MARRGRPKKNQEPEDVTDVTPAEQPGSAAAEASPEQTGPEAAEALVATEAPARQDDASAVSGESAPTENDPEPEKPADPDAPRKMTPEEIAEALKKADFTIVEKPEKRSPTSEALMFKDGEKVTPARIMERVEEQRAKMKAAAATVPDTGPRVETRAAGRRTIRHN